MASRGAGTAATAILMVSGAADAAAEPTPGTLLMVGCTVVSAVCVLAPGLTSVVETFTGVGVPCSARVAPAASKRRGPAHAPDAALPASVGDRATFELSTKVNCESSTVDISTPRLAA
jgi:hypothetical protein